MKGRRRNIPRKGSTIKALSESARQVGQRSEQNILPGWVTLKEAGQLGGWWRKADDGGWDGALGEFGFVCVECEVPVRFLPGDA